MSRQTITLADFRAMLARNPHLSEDKPVDQGENPKPKVKRSGPKKGEMNKTEAAYAEELRLLERRGDIKEWAFEPFRLRYGAAAYYTPDFVVLLPGFPFGVKELSQLAEAGSAELVDNDRLFRLLETLRLGLSGVEIHEVKGGYIYPEAKPRFKAAALRYPWAEFKMMQLKGRSFRRIL